MDPPSVFSGKTEGESKNIEEESQLKKITYIDSYNRQRLTVPLLGLS